MRNFIFILFLNCLLPVAEASVSRDEFESICSSVNHAESELPLSARSLFDYNLLGENYPKDKLHTDLLLIQSKIDLFVYMSGIDKFRVKDNRPEVYWNGWKIADEMEFCLYNSGLIKANEIFHELDNAAINLNAFKVAFHKKLIKEFSEQAEKGKSKIDPDVKIDNVSQIEFSPIEVISEGFFSNQYLVSLSGKNSGYAVFSTKDKIPQEKRYGEYVVYNGEEAFIKNKNGFTKKIPLYESISKDSPIAKSWSGDILYKYFSALVQEHKNVLRTHEAPATELSEQLRLKKNELLKVEYLFNKSRSDFLSEQERVLQYEKSAKEKREKEIIEVENARLLKEKEEAIKWKADKVEKKRKAEAVLARNEKYSSSVNKCLKEAVNYDLSNFSKTAIKPSSMQVGSNNKLEFRASDVKSGNYTIAEGTVNVEYKYSALLLLVHKKTGRARINTRWNRKGSHRCELSL